MVIVVPRCSQDLERQVSYDWWSSEKYKWKTEGLVTKLKKDQLLAFSEVERT